MRLANTMTWTNYTNRLSADEHRRLAQALRVGVTSAAQLGVATNHNESIETVIERLDAALHWLGEARRMLSGLPDEPNP